MSTTALATIQRIIAEALMIPVDSIRADDPIANLKNIDSLSFAMIIVGIETETGSKIDPVDLMPLQTVGDLTKLLEKLQQPQ